MQLQRPTRKLEKNFNYLDPRMSFFISKNCVILCFFSEKKKDMKEKKTTDFSIYKARDFLTPLDTSRIFSTGVETKTWVSKKVFSISIQFWLNVI